MAAAHTPRMNCGEMAGNRLTVCELKAFAHLVSISSNLLLHLGTALAYEVYQVDWSTSMNEPSYTVYSPCSTHIRCKQIEGDRKIKLPIPQFFPSYLSRHLHT